MVKLTIQSNRRSFCKKSRLITNSLERIGVLARGYVGELVIMLLARCFKCIIRKVLLYLIGCLLLERRTFYLVIYRSLCVSFYRILRMWPTQFRSCLFSFPYWFLVALQPAFQATYVGNYLLLYSV